MNKRKGRGISGLLAVLLLLFVVFAPAPASAYDYSGYKWAGTSAVYGWDWWGSVPAEWKSSIRDAATTWNAAGSVFRLNEDFWTGNIYTAQLASNVQADATIWLSGNTITSSRIRFNNQLSWSTTGESGKHDVQDVATHEFGHWLKLNDLYGSGDTEKTMYYAGSSGQTKRRTLEQDDKNGIIYIYG